MVIVEQSRGACQQAFYGTQYDLYDRLKKNSYVIEKDIYVRIRG
jgi:hypothetical protein